MKNCFLVRRLVLFLLLLMGSSLIVSAQSRFTYQGIRYQITGSSTVKVISSYSGYSGDIVIPSTATVTTSFYGEYYNVTYRVAAIGDNAFYNSTNLRSVTLPNSVTLIGESAFSGCSSLTSVSLPYGLTSIGKEAFYQCTALQSITIPNTVSTIGWNAFYGCTALTDVVLPKGIKALNGTFIGCSSLSEIRIPASVNTLDGTFTQCSSLVSVVIPNSVITVGDRTFEDCTSLLSVYIPNSVNYIGERAFRNTSLQIVTLPNQLQNIGNYAFDLCNDLTSITSRADNPPALSSKNCFLNELYNNAFVSVPQQAFNAYKSANWWKLFVNLTGSEALNNVYDFAVNGIYYIKCDDDNVYVTYKDTNYNSYSGSINIPSSVTHGGKTYQVLGIGHNAFYKCYSLSSVTIPNSVTSIGSSAFYQCTGLTSLSIPKYVTSIGEEAFSECSGLTSLTWNAINCPSNGDMSTSNLTSVTIGTDVELLPDNFVSGSKITSIAIPGTVVSIGKKAFYNCTGLTALTIPKAVCSIAEKAFDGCNNLKTLEWNAQECWSNGNMYTSNLEQITIGNAVQVIPSGFASNSKISTITLPSSVQYIGSSAFYYCTSLAGINLPDQLETIEGSAFYGCSSITSLTIPETVHSIDDGAFSSCYGLTSLTWNAIDCGKNGNMPASNINSVTIGDGVKKLPSDFVSGSKITSVSLPNSVDSIYSSAFSGCTGLTSIDIPNSVTYIGNSAFNGCSGLTSIVIPNSITSIDFDTFRGCSGLTSISIPNSVTHIDCYAFFNCDGLANITVESGNTTYDSRNNCNAIIETSSNTLVIGCKNTIIPNSVTTIGSSAFDSCKGLSGIDIPESVTTIDTHAFSYCIGLTNVKIGPSVSEINYGAFQGCSSLKTFISLAIDPPSLGYSVFDGVPQDMCVYVLPSSVAAYKSAYGWKQFEILPISNSQILSVSLPENVNAQDYANMRLEVTDAESGNEQHYTLTDKSFYTFTVEPNTIWNVKLTNQYGDLFGKIEHVVVGEENVSVAFSSLLKPQDVSLKVNKPNGHDVTALCKISWFDEDGELLLQGNPIKKLPAGHKLKYQVTLPQELATAYTLPSVNTYTVNSSNNNIICQLGAIGQTQLSGKVKDATNNQALYGATISALQSFGGGTTKTLTATTDNQGQYSLDASTVPTTLTIAANGYINQTIDCDMSSGGSNTVTVPDVALSPITGAVVNINLTYTPAHVEGEAAETQNWYDDYSNVDYEVYNATAGHALTNVSVQYPQIVLMEVVNDGDVLELTATSRKNAFKPVKATVTIAEQRATATFNIKQLGQISSSFSKNINPKVTGSLYDTEANLVKSSDYTGSTLSLEDLADGDYKLITMGKSDFYNSIYDLDQLSAVGLQSGIDYVEKPVQVKSGLISNVTIDEVPFLDESKFYYTGDHTSFSVNKPSIVLGNYLTFRAQLDFKEQYANKVSDVQLIVDLPESCSFMPNSVMTGSNMAGYSISGNRITVPLANWNVAVVRFCAIPTVSGDFSPSAFVRFKLNGKYITQPIGNAQFTAKGLSIEVPSITSSNTVLIHGTAFPQVNIEVYDNDVLVGQTVASGDGNWSYNYEIPDTSFNCTYHKIYAIAYKDEFQLLTETKILAYHSSAVYVRSVDMIFGPYSYNFNFDNPSTTGYSYTYPTCGNDFTFIVNFSDNDSDAVSNVKVNVLLMDNSIETLDAVYDSSKSRWIAHGVFPYSTRLPINLNVVFDGPLMIPFDDTNRRECENQNVQNSMQEIEDYVDSNIDFELKDDYEDHVSFLVNSPLTETQWIVSAKAIDRNNVNLEDGFAFIPEESYYYKDEYTDDGHFTATIVDNDSAFVIEFYRYSAIGSMPSCAPRWWNTIVNVVDVVSDFFIPYKSYIKGVIDYNFWVKDRYPWYMDAITQENEWTYAALDAICKDGSYRLSNEQRQFFFDKIQIYQKLENDFYNSVDALANLWSQRLRNAFYYEALTSCVGKAFKAIPHAQFFKPNGKGGGLMRYVVEGGLEKRNQAEELIENVFDHFVQGIELVGDWTEFMDYESVSEEFHNYLNDGYNNFRELYSDLRSDIRASYKKCDKKEEAEDEFPFPPLKPYIDPSGFVYEGVPSNRLQGVTATCYYKETVEDMYGDLHEEIVLWDAENYGQENPLITDENGFYRWDVPVGMWQVKYEKEGYETTYSDWLPVPPPQLDVNIGMVQMRQPEVMKAHAYPKAVEFEFDKFMFPETLNSSNITVFVNGSAVNGTIELLNAEVDDPLAITSIRRAPGTGLTFASKVRFNANSPFNADKVTLRVKKDVKSYADLGMNEDYEAVLYIEPEMQSIEVDPDVKLLYGDSRQLTVSVLPAAASKGKTLSVRSVAPMIATTDAETYTINNNGKAVITVHGDLPGMTTLLYSIEGYDLTASTLVNVMMESEMTVATPTASVASGSEVPNGTAVYLRCTTEGATIYYTLDGSCPCDNTPARKVYDGTPIIINSNTTIKAMATAPDLYDSDVATFIYRVGHGLKGDVNGDGEVNIADVNVLIEIILGGNVDADTRARADVNDDAEVNIGDVNALIDMILHPAHVMTPKVNCDDKLHLENVSMKPGDVRNLQVNVDHASQYSAMQCDIVLPAGLTLLSTTSTGDHLSKIDNYDGTTSRALSYSPSKMPFASNGQGILTITVRADEALAEGSEILLTNVVLADAENKAWYLADCVARVDNASGVNDLTVVADRIWVEGQTLFIDARHDGIAQLATINGIVCEIPVKAGVNQYRLDQGIYIVVINGKSHKIAIK